MRQKKLLTQEGKVEELVSKNQGVIEALKRLNTQISNENTIKQDSVENIIDETFTHDVCKTSS